MVDAVQDDLHRLAADLRPASLDHLGLVAALRHYLAEVDRQHPQIVEFETVGLDGERLPAEVEIALFRIAQEAVTNSIRARQRRTGERSRRAARPTDHHGHRG